MLILENIRDGNLNPRKILTVRLNKLEIMLIDLMSMEKSQK